MVPDKTKEYVKTVSAHKGVQTFIVEAMFGGCEVGTDIWEYVPSDLVLPEHIHRMIFGLTPAECEQLDQADDPEEASKIDALTDTDCIYFHPAASSLLIEEVKNRILESVKKGT